MNENLRPRQYDPDTDVYFKNLVSNVNRQIREDLAREQNGGITIPKYNWCDVTTFSTPITMGVEL